MINFPMKVRTTTCKTHSHRIVEHTKHGAINRDVRSTRSNCPICGVAQAHCKCDIV